VSGGPASRSELLRWLVCGAVVVLAHASAAALVANWSDPIAAAEPSGAITIDLAPLATSTAEAQDDSAPGPQMTAAPTPPVDAPEQKADETPPDKPPEQTIVAEHKIEPPPVEQPPLEQPKVEPTPPAPKPDVQAAVPPPKPPEPREKPKPARPSAPATAAPQRAPRLAAIAAAPSQGQVSASVNAMPSWRGQIFAAIARQKRTDVVRTEQGKPIVAFVIDRHGHLLSSSLSTSSGAATLDQEALAMVRRAQFPPAPAEIVGTNFNFAVPIYFH